MPVLNTERKTSRLVLPSSTPEDEAWVEIYEDLLVSDVIELSNNTENPTKGTISALASIIKDWNFTDKDGNKSEISFDTVKFMTLEDLIFITEKAKAFTKLNSLADAKKKI